MSNKSMLAPAVLTLCLVQGTAVLAEELSTSYLVGTWSFQGKENCRVAGAEHVQFKENGTFEHGPQARVDSVGFWHVDENRVELHLVSSPHRLDDTLLGYKGQYGYAYLPVFAFDIESDAFDAVVEHEGEIRKRTVYRCP